MPYGPYGTLWQQIGTPQTVYGFTNEPEDTNGLLHLRARLWARSFFDWYNHQHYHSGLNLLTPASVHFGDADHIRRQRQQILAAAYARHPQRFVQGSPVVKGPPDAVWINPPTQQNLP